MHVTADARDEQRRVPIDRFALEQEAERSTAPALPPAPTMPLTAPSARRLMNGTTAYVAPFDIFTNRRT